MKLTPTSFRKWMKKHNLTVMKCGIALGYKVQTSRFCCATVTTILNGTWTGWGNKMAEFVLECKMKKYEESLK